MNRDHSNAILASTYSDATHIAFFDESKWNKGRFRSISMISMCVEDYLELNNGLQNICEQRSKEIKWTNVNERTGIDLLDFTFDNLHKMRVDILIWDIEDSRHRGVAGRDDQANLQRLYYRLMHTVMRDKWADDAVWALFPDEQRGIDWNVITSFLMRKSESSKFEIDIDQRIKFISKTNYVSADIEQCKSHEFPFIQLADFFAGIACYSHTEYPKISIYQDQTRGQMNIFDVGVCINDELVLSNRDKNRVPLVWYIKAQSAKKKYGVSLESTKGLVTRNPNAPLNFWMYSPQHDLDKAPRKQS